MNALAKVIEERDAAVNEVVYLRQVLKDVTDGEFQLEGETGRLTRWERRLLCILARAKGAVVRHDAIMAALYYERNPDEVPGSKIVGVWAFKIRNKLVNHRIETHWGVGYSLHPIIRKDR